MLYKFLTGAAVPVIFAVGCSGTDSPPSAVAGAPAGSVGGYAGSSVGGTGSVGGVPSTGGLHSTGGSDAMGGALPHAGASSGGAANSGGAASSGGGGTNSGGSGGAGSGGQSAGGQGAGGQGAGPDPSQKRAAYIYGSVSENGTIPAPAGQEYEPMRLTDTGSEGCSEYKAEVEKLGYSITEVYDRTTTFDAAFLKQYNVIVFGNHQKVMNADEQAAIAAWVYGGGGLLTYNDSALGGKYDVAGISNTVGQKAVNSIISQFGMQVLTDQGNGVCAMKGSDSDTNPIIHTGGTSLIIEGEGEPPVCVDRNAGVKILIPFSEAAKVGTSGNVSTNNAGGGMTIANPLYAALALKEHGKGNVIAQFDRQMMWNDGPGSSIKKRDNREIEKRIFQYLAHML
jgi:hypothetical protein